MSHFWCSSRRAAVCSFLSAMAPVFLGCQSDAKPAVATTTQAIDLVSIGARTMQSGFATGKLRRSRELASYKIAKHPVTWGQFDACVSAGACAAPDGSACGAEAYAPYAKYTAPKYDAHDGQAPAVCVGESQAEAFCRFAGGRLPTVDEWLVASRGDAPRRYSWGDDVSACEQHPLAGPMLQARQVPDALPTDSPLPTCAPREFDGTELRVGTHVAGASPLGLEDVLLAPGELLAGDANTLFNACGAAGSNCVVYGLEPGAIDSVEPFYHTTRADGTAGAAMVAHAYAFRCVIDAQKKDMP
jgi:hypothetical protein